jgi:sugar fermentation stimulation protein A
LRTRRRQHFIEVKNCHLVYPDGRGYFPDAVSERATHHLMELMRVVENGHRATVLFTVQHPVARSLRPSDAHDPVFAQTARQAAAAGVRFRALLIEPTLEGLVVHRTIPVDLKPYATRRQERWRHTFRSRRSSHE